MANTYSQIISDLLTKQDVDNLTDEIDILIDSLYKTDSSIFNDVLSNQIRASTAEKINSLFEKEKNKKGVLEGLKSELAKLKPMQVTLAYEPTLKSKVRIKSWVKKNIGEFSVLKIRVDSRILGGAIVVSNGKYHDYSLRKAIEAGIRSNNSNLIKKTSVLKFLIALIALISN